MSSMEVSFQLYLNIKVACNSMHFFSGKLSWENIKTVEKQTIIELLRNEEATSM